jgi:uncharacterized oxidoreductase
MDWNVIDNNMLSILIDPAKLGGADSFAAETERVIEWVYSTPAAASFDRVRIPGEPEREMRAQRGASGVPLDPTTWGEIVACAVTLGFSRSEVSALSGVSVTA